MAKKLRTLTESDDNQLIEAVRSSAHLIWQAGLGAFARAQEEGDKAFASLIDAGSDLQKRMRGADINKGLGGNGALGKAAETIGKQAAESWGKVEHAFEDRLSNALRNIGVPTHEDIQQLAQQIEELRTLVEVLPGRASSKRQPVTEATAAPAKRRAAKSAAKEASKVATRRPPVKAAAGSAEKKTPGSTV